MLTIDELKKLSAKELQEEFEKTTKDLFKIRFEVDTGSSKAHDKIRKLRHYRAQIKTVETMLNKEESKNEKVMQEVKETKEDKPKK